ncbi:MAG: DNA polymerase III subunit beta [Candidatus Taylorbacteria bacterium RIFCSPLOWO2_12_FULL_47_20]|uniref:Beta sliding clamp n=2 Tax=Candidatus Tayloriibacteriota TaxID=1817919 RepID=A0A1G2P7A6_9BACT|nr:MAG: DNA polymerase III subunit beta [Candidatus Taylorbacteria bacterium RIFCSPLOWO2_02_FULL_46_40]OHA44163.1 MAG: DNA polymerase III subunit beta [Candidatus Taylorbacteria bacterium RIFCSPLOWO2_12_FULL_47_20]
MKFEITKEKIVNLISLISRIPSKHSNLPILECVFFELKNNSLTLRATNLEIGLEINVLVRGSGDGSVAVYGNIINSFFQNLQGDKNILFESVNNSLAVSCGDISVNLKTLPADDFPTIPEAAGGEVKISAKYLHKGLKTVLFSASLSGLRPDLSSVYVYSEGENLIFAATDSFRLAEKKIKNKTKEKIGFLLPIKNAIEMVRLLEGETGEVVMSVHKNQISIKTPNMFVTSRLVEGNFPDYGQIIPKEYSSEALILKDDLAQALKLANIFSDSFNQVTFLFTPAKKNLEVTTRGGQYGGVNSVIRGQFKGESLEMNYNHRYASECLSSIESDSVSILLAGAHKPTVIRGSGDPSFTYLVMPLNK